MHFVRSKEAGVWTDTGSRFLVRSLVKALWAVNQQGVVVEPGLVLGFNRQEDAVYLLEAHVPREPADMLKKPEEPKADQVYVEVGSIVCFHDARDAAYFVEKGRGDPMSEQDVVAAMQAYAEQQTEPVQHEEPADVHKPKMENKAQETKAPTAPKGGKAKGGKKA